MIARLFGVSEHCVRLRIRRLARRAFEFHSELLASQHYKITESVCYDGLENFASSQYDPNNINHLVGRDSLFIYDFNFACLNRKGRQSPWQRNRLGEIESVAGRYNPKAIRVATAAILRRAHATCVGGKMRLLSDEHFQYRKALVHELGDLDIEHVTISSKACRNFQNILFSVNHSDMLIRQRIAAFTRETISFSKTPGAMCQRYALFLVHKNYMVPQFTKKHVRRPHAHKRSPAQMLGLCEGILGFTDIFSRRSWRKPQSLNRDWSFFYDGHIPPEYHRLPNFRRDSATHPHSTAHS